MRVSGRTARYPDRAFARYDTTGGRPLEDCVRQPDSESDRSILRAGGVPETAVEAWLEAIPAATGVFTDDARSHGVFWRVSDELIGHLPEKPARAPAQAAAAAAIFSRAREMRERFL